MLGTIREDLKAFQNDLVSQLTQDIGQLQAEKVKLLSDIAQLRDQKQTLESETHNTLSQHQVAQQQIWAKQLAQALATRLYLLLSEKIQDSAPSQDYRPQPIHTAATANYYPLANRSTEQSLTSLHTVVEQSLSSLTQDLDSYQSSLNQQLGRMENLQRQGEAILETLVSRLNQRLQDTSALHPGSNDSFVDETSRQMQLGRAGHATYESGSGQGVSSLMNGRVISNGSAASNHGLASQAAPVFSSEDIHSSTRMASSNTPHQGAAYASSSHLGQQQHVQSPSRGESLKRRFSSIPSFQRGLVLILLSTVALSLHNVVVQVIGNESSIFNIWRVGGYVPLSLDSSLMILWLRMIVVMPLMAFIATFLHPATWSDIKKFAMSRDRTQLRNVISSGFFLFLSQVCIYIAIGEVGPGVAVTILFMYPIFTVPLAWWLFGDRPTSLRVLVMIAIFGGVVCTFLPKLVQTNQVSVAGVGIAVFSGLAFACYLISMQLSFKKLHPVPVSVIQFFTIFSLTSIILLARPADVELSSPVGLILGGLVLGFLTLLGYLFNNFGVRLMGAARASIIASSGPVLTALLAFIIIREEQTQLAPIQILGILIVTAGVTALAVERMFLQKRQARQAVTQQKKSAQANMQQGSPQSG
ncbi:MAG: EamA family transporter [Leptolyngbyaceae bacterium]|nr:EamA family transporter [Leptolyngbyaceae bacterium]